MIENQALANAIFELTSVMPMRSNPRFIRKKEVDPVIRQALTKLENYLGYYSRMATAPEVPVLLNAVDLLMEQYNQVNNNAELKTVATSAKTRTETMSDSSVNSMNVDVVIPFRAGVSKHGEQELRFALRSIERHLIGYRNIIVVTDSPPEWLQNAKVISVTDDSRKNINLFRKRVAAAEYSDADYNLYCCDDYVFLKNIHALKVPALTCGRDMASYMGNRVWFRCLRTTAAVLKKHGKTSHHCESHTPSLVDRQKFLTLAETFKIERETEPGLAVCGLYHNYYGTRMLPMNNFKATFETDAGGVDAITEKCEHKFFLGYNDKGFESGVRDFLSQQFPTLSQYESQ